MARGGGGGGRSGSRGGGGSRGGRTGSSGRRSGGGMGGRSMGGRSSFGGGGHRHSRPPRPPRHHHHGHHHHHHTHHTYYGGRRSGGGCSSVLAAILLITIVSFVIMSQACTATLQGLFGGCAGISGNTEVQSTKTREKLDKDLVDVTDDWYYDALGLINHESDLIRGMEVFYEETGIQPYLYISEVSANGLSDDEADRISNEIYDDLFTDEGHLLLCYFQNENENEDDFPYLTLGRDTTNIMDDEAEKIFWGEFWKNYDNLDYTHEEFLGETFKDAGREIMDTPIPWSTVAIVVAVIGGVIIIIIIIVNVWKARIAQKNKEQEDLERMLDKPLETFGDSVDDLKEKYDNQE